MKPIVYLISVAFLIAILPSCGGGGGGGSTSTSFFNARTQIDNTGFSNSAVGDFDGDGDEDLVVTFYGSDPGNDNVQPWQGVPIKVYLQNASGNLVDNTSTMLNTIPEITLARHIEVADFNNDGADDIYFGNHGLEIGDSTDWYEKDVLLLSNGAGGFHDDAMATNIPVFSGFYQINNHNFYTHGVDSADIDNDGDIDLVLNMLFGFNGLVVLENDGAGVFSIKSTSLQAELWVQFIKANNDIYPDLFIGNGDVAGSHAIHINDGSGNFNAGTIVMPTPMLDGKIEEAHVADINGDSREDLIIGNTNAAFTDHVVQVLINDYDTTTSFIDETLTRFPNPIAFTNNYNPSFAMRDMDNDGDKDLIMVKTNNVTFNSEVGVYLNDNFALTRITALTELNQYFALIDLGGDGLVDVVEASGGVTYVHRANTALTN